MHIKNLANHGIHLKQNNQRNRESDENIFILSLKELSHGTDLVESGVVR
jgi:hypothetical protein